MTIYQILFLATIGAIMTIVPVHAMSANVVSIGDGDTLTVQNGVSRRTIRLACIDAPEMAQSPWGVQSKAKLQALLPIGTPIRVREVEVDRYGRLVGEVFVGNRSINLEMVKTGHAVIYRQYFAGCSATAAQYNQAELGAKSTKTAFWGQSCPYMPWDYRAGLAATCNGVPRFRGYIAGTCTQLADQGVYGPFYRSQGDPNYTAARDRDNDGIACER